MPVRDGLAHGNVRLRSARVGRGMVRFACPPRSLKHRQSISSKGEAVRGQGPGPHERWEGCQPQHRNPAQATQGPAQPPALWRALPVQDSATLSRPLAPPRMGGGYVSTSIPLQVGDPETAGVM